MAMAEGNNVNFQGEHALLNRVVLKNLFEYLKPCGGLDTLKSIRQVCTVWRDESLDWWRETAVLRLTREMIEDPQLTIITKLLADKPFHKYKLKDITVFLGMAQNSQDTHFWTTVGPHMKHLTFEDVQLIARSLGRQTGGAPPRRIGAPTTTLMQFLIYLLPNLTTFVVDNCFINFVDIEARDMDDSYGKWQHPGVVSLNCTSFRSFKHFAFKNFPNLQRLALDDFKKLTLMQTDKEGDAATLKHLDIILPEGETLREADGTLEDLRSMKYPVLERLTVDYRNERHNSGFKFLPVFLKNHCENLKTLEVNCWPYVRAYSNFPFECQLDQLTELRLWGNVVKDLSFLKWTPKLKLLHMDVYGLEKQDNCNMHPEKCSIEFKGGYVEVVKEGDLEGVVLHHLEYLQINCRLYLNEPIKSLKRLGKWMPNLKTLNTVLEPGFIGVICEQWPLLEHLVATHGSTLNNKDIIGKGKAPGIKGLKDLVELKTFHLNATCDKGHLTDMVVRSGFLKMSKLTHLQVCVSDKFSVGAEKLLKERFCKVEVIRNYSGNEEHENWKCCKDKAFIDFLEGIDRSVGGSGSDTTSEDDSDRDEFSDEEDGSDNLQDEDVEEEEIDD